MHTLENKVNSAVKMQSACIKIFSNEPKSYVYFVCPLLLLPVCNHYLSYEILTFPFLCTYLYILYNYLPQLN